MRKGELAFNLLLWPGIAFMGLVLAGLLVWPLHVLAVACVGVFIVILLFVRWRGNEKQAKTVGCLAAAVTAVVIIALMGISIVERTLQGIRRPSEESLRRYMSEQFDEIMQGKRSDLYIYTFSNFNELLADPESAARVVSIRGFECPASQHEWSLLKQLTNLNELSLYCCGDIDPVLEGIKGMASLERVFLSGTTYFTDKGMACMPSFVNLKTLRVFGPVTGAGLAQLRGHPSLECLILTMTDVTDDGLAVLKDMPRLRHLAIEYDRQWAAERAKSGFNHGTGPTDASLSHLKPLTQLESLNLDGDWVSEAAVDDLRKALPNCKITVSSVVAGE